MPAPMGTPEEPGEGSKGVLTGAGVVPREEKNIRVKGGEQDLPKRKLTPVPRNRG